MTEPLRATEAKERIRRFLVEGAIRYTQHALDEMDDLTFEDCENVFRGGVVDEAEWENGNWRHRVRTTRMVFVVQFEAELGLLVITGWRKAR